MPPSIALRPRATDPGAGGATTVDCRYRHETHTRNCQVRQLYAILAAAQPAGAVENSNKTMVVIGNRETGYPIPQVSSQYIELYLSSLAGLATWCAPGDGAVEQSFEAGD